MSAFARGILVALGLACFASCRRAPSPSPPPAPGDERAPADLASDARAAPAASARLQRKATLRLADVRLRIDDVHMSGRFDDALARASASLVVNGGFFDPAGQPLGLSVSDGKRMSAFSSEMSGGVLWIRDGVGHLTATEEFDGGAVDFAVQCRPRLVVSSRVNIRRDDGRRARRTALCLRDEGRTLDVWIVGENATDVGPTLFELAHTLADAGCEDALNLDGGPSTGWASKLGDGGVDFVAPRGVVRQLVVVTPATP